MDELIVIRNKFSEEFKNENKFKCIFFMKEVIKNDISVNFYIGILSVVCLMIFFNLL